MYKTLFKTANGVGLVQDEDGSLVSTNPCEVIAALKKDCKSSNVLDVIHAADMLSYITSKGGIYKQKNEVRDCIRTPQHFYAYEDAKGQKVCGYASADIMDKKVNANPFLTYPVKLVVW